MKLSLFQHQTSLWLPFLSGILLSLTLPEFGLWPLVWVALVPFLFFVSDKRTSSRRLFVGTALFAVPYAIAIVYPLMRVTSWWWSVGAGSFGMLGLEIKFACIVILIGCWGALFFFPFTYILRRFSTTSMSLVVVAFSWVLLEWVRSSFGLLGYSWGVLGYTLLDTTYLKHLAALSGVYALSFLIVLGNLSLLELILISKDKDKFAEKSRNFLACTCSALRVFVDTPRRYIGVWFFVGFFVSVLCFGVAREYHIFSPLSTCMQSSLRVAVVSSDIPTRESIGKGAYLNYRTKTEEALSSDAKLVILPENAFPFFELNESDNSLNEHNLIPLPEQDELYANFLSLSRMHPSVTIALGLHTNGAGARYNSLVLFQNGEPVQYYHKRKLVPFAEYAPFGLGMSLVEPLHAGAREQYFSVGGVKATGLMCSEVGDTTIPLRDARIILASSNDSVFASPAAAGVEHQMARMRALEAGAYLLRASKGGLSSIIDPNGNILESGHGGVLIADICPESSKPSLP